jgi:hypothetical protein
LPARSTSQSSMQSAPSTIANKIAITLRPAFAAPRPITPQPHPLRRQRFDPEPLCERRDEHHPRVRDRALVIELDPQTIQSDRLVIMHHEGDLLTAGPGCRIQPLKPCTGGHSSLSPGRNPPSDTVDRGLAHERTSPAPVR